MSDVSVQRTDLESGVIFASRARLLDRVRASEVIALVIMSVFISLTSRAGVLLALPILGCAVVLVPRDRLAAEAARAAQRLRLIDRLRADGLALRAGYLNARSKPLGGERRLALLKSREAIRDWMRRSSKDLGRYPEFCAIFLAHRATGGLIDEFDSCMERLSDLRQLCSLSDRLGLPV